jgi:predicted nucleic-acid-binding Zn-ribbon protein
MKRFDAKAVCPKCGSPNVASWHHQASRGEWRSRESSCYDLSTEHVDRTCRRCHYGWAEAPLDAGAKP